MASFFLACFLFGAVFTLVASVLGIGDHGVGAAHGDLPDGPPVGHPWLILNVSTAVAFLTWFGAVGYLLLRVGGWPLLLTLVAALAGGLLAAFFVGGFIAKIREGDRPIDPADYRLEGSIAKVSVSIPENGVGEIIFTLADRRRSEAARSEHGQAIPRETEVAILSYDNGVATVAPWSQLMASSSPTASL